MPSLNSYNNAKAIYANKKWKFWSPYLKHVPVLYNTKNGNAFTITAGGRKKLGQAVYRYGPGKNNYVSSDLVYEARGSIRKRSAKTNTITAYMARLAKKPAQNLVQLFMRYQSGNAGGFYVTNEKGRIMRNGNYGPEKPTRKKVLANIKNWKNYNIGPFGR